MIRRATSELRYLSHDETELFKWKLLRERSKAGCREPVLSPTSGSLLLPTPILRYTNPYTSKLPPFNIEPTLNLPYTDSYPTLDHPLTYLVARRGIFAALKLALDFRPAMELKSGPAEGWKLRVLNGCFS